MIPTVKHPGKDESKDRIGEKSKAQSNKTKEVTSEKELEIVSLRISNKLKGKGQTTNSLMETDPKFIPSRVDAYPTQNLKIKKIVTRSSKYVLIIKYINESSLIGKKQRSKMIFSLQVLLTSRSSARKHIITLDDVVQLQRLPSNWHSSQEKGPPADIMQQKSLMVQHHPRNDKRTIRSHTS